MSDWTPGPWRLARTPDDGGDDFQIWMGEFDGSGRVIHHIRYAEDIFPQTDPTCYPEALANARLIAQAPALVAVLEKIVFDWDGEPEDMAEARKVLARVRGK